MKGWESEEGLIAQEQTEGTEAQQEATELHTPSSALIPYQSIRRNPACSMRPLGACLSDWCLLRDGNIL